MIRIFNPEISTTCTIKKSFVHVSILICALFARAEEGTTEGRRTRVMPPVYVTSVNPAVPDVVVAPGSRVPVEVELRVAKPWGDRGQHELAISWYLAPTSVGTSPSKETVLAHGTYLGRTSVRSPSVGTSTYSMRIPVVGAVDKLEGEYALIAWVDQSERIFEKEVRRIFRAPFAVKVDPAVTTSTTVQIASFVPDLLSVVPIGNEPQLIEGTLALEALRGAAFGASVSFCLRGFGAECSPLEVFDPKSQQFGSGYVIDALEQDEEVTTMFRVKLPSIESGQDVTLKAQVWSGIPYQGVPLDSAERSISVESAPYVVSRTVTDFERELLQSRAQAKRAQKQRRLQGHYVTPAKLLRSKKEGDATLDLDTALARIVANAPKTQPLTKVQIENTRSLPDGLIGTISGSRFNMPDGDFPWLNNIGVTAPPPPEQYKGTPFARLEDYTRCIPFFCGPNSPSEAGREPSQSCIRQYCGTTKEDVNFGGRNANLIDEQIGFDKNFSGGGFGARVGVVGQAKVYHDKAISDYVAASYEVAAFFGVKVFGYSVPIFEAGSQSVYSPTEIGNSGTRHELKILGLLIEREDAPSAGLSLRLSKTYGVKKNADIGLGPISVDIEVEAGGTGAITLAVTQIDILRGITGSLTPSAGCGAKAKALTNVGIGSFGIQGELNLFEDRLPATATFNAGLDISKKKVTPQLDFDIRNELDGPNGKIKLVLEIEFPPASFSTTIASFSTGTFVTPIYDQTKTFGSVSY